MSRVSEPRPLITVPSFEKNLFSIYKIDAAHVIKAYSITQFVMP